MESAAAGVCEEHVGWKGSCPLLGLLWLSSAFELAWVRLAEFRDVFHRSHECDPFAGVLNARVRQAVAVAIVRYDRLSSDGVAVLYDLVHADEAS